MHGLYFTVIYHIAVVLADKARFSLRGSQRRVRGQSWELTGRPESRSSSRKLMRVEDVVYT